MTEQTTTNNQSQHRECPVCHRMFTPEQEGQHAAFEFQMAQARQEREREQASQ